MSTCPSKELYSAFVDGEVASPWNNELKEHAELCDACKDYVAQYTRTKQAFAKDSESLNLDEKALDESFVRLQQKMRFSEVSKKSRNVYTHIPRKVIPYAVAAAFLVAVILPTARVSGNMQHFATVAISTPMTSAELINKTGVAADQNINVSAVKVADTSSHAKAVAPKPTALHVSNLTKVDVFKPEFSQETAGINIRLTDVSELPLIVSDVQADVYPATDFYQ